MSYTITEDILEKIAGIKTPLMKSLSEEISKTCQKFEIDTKKEFAHFLAQACHETDHFKTLEEYASGKAYEGRKDLGNIQSGDGMKYKGRGIFQTTGRSNYKQLGVEIGKPNLFIQNPSLLKSPEYAVWSACVYWKSRNLNDIANHDDSDRLKKKYRGQIVLVSPVEYISMTINGGKNGLQDRINFYQRALKVLPDEDKTLSIVKSIFELVDKFGESQNSLNS